MKIVRNIAFATAIVCAGTAGAEESPLPLGHSRAALTTDHAKDWSQTRLILEPDLRQQIEWTKRVIDTNATRLESEISQLKNDGFLDRRSSAKIRNALHQAQSSIAQITDRIEANEPIDGWTARMTSYELGLAADALARQADAVDMALGSSPGSDGGGPGGNVSEGEQPQNLAKILRESSRLSKKTARSIVRHLE